VRAVLAWIGSLIHAIGRIALQLLRWFGAPFVYLWRFYWRRSNLTKIIVAVVLSPWLFGYVAFAWNAAWIRGYDINYPSGLGIEQRAAPPGVQIGDGGSCGTSYIVEAASDLIDLNVNRNAWMPSNPFYKMGFLFLIDWERTKFFDNKAAFQLGVHQAVHRTLTELADALGRERGTSPIDPDLEAARGNIQFDTATWIFNPFSSRPFGPTTRSQVYYRSAEASLRDYQTRLGECDAKFDARADNLLQFLDRIAADIGSTSAQLMARSETHNSGWFDTRADDLFMFAKGQMYAYYGILAGARADFAEVIESRDVANVWDNMMDHIAHAIALSPMVISNGAEDGWFMPSHLTAIGFYILRARSNLVEIRSVLDR
jgi:hypothetical protein